MKKIIALTSLLPIVSHAHNDASSGIFANLMHQLSSPHHAFFALVSVVVVVGLVKAVAAKDKSK